MADIWTAGMFGRLSSDLKDIANYFGNIYTAINGDPSMLFREVFQVDLDSAVAKWAEVSMFIPFRILAG